MAIAAHGINLISSGRERAFFAPGRRITSPVLRISLVGSRNTDWTRAQLSGHDVTLVAEEALAAGAGFLPDADVVVFDLVSPGPDVALDDICFELHRHGVVTIGIAPSAANATWTQLCHYEIRFGEQPTLFDNVETRPLGRFESAGLAALAGANERRRRPSISLLAERGRVASKERTDLGHAGLAVDLIPMARKASMLDWARAIEAARGDVVVLIAAGGGRSVVELVQTCVFEHWYPYVELCCEPLDPRDRGELDLRRLSFRGERARADVVAALRASQDRETADSALSASLVARGAAVVTIEDAGPDRHAGPRDQSKTLAARGLSWMRARLSPRSPPPAGRPKSDRRFRILAYRWHVAHQYELMRLPADFTLADGFEGHITESWAYEQRPMPANVSFRHRSDIDPRDYDVALVHFDENVLCPDLSNGVLPSTWGEPFEWLLSLAGVPKIGICHGTPAFEGQYALDPGRKTSFEIHEAERAALVAALVEAGAHVVCNSFQAQREWGFANSRVIWHGFDPSEFHKGSLSRGVLTSPDDARRPHYRGRFELQDVLRDLEPGIDVTRHLRQVPLEQRWTNTYASHQFRSYVEQISAFKFYLNTTLRSPMPRSRGEAMMTGVIPVSLANHDADMFTENGRDGFVSVSTAELAAFINEVARDPRALAAMSEAARAKAIDVFHISRFQADWLRLLKDVIG